MSPGDFLPKDWVRTTLGEAFNWASGGTPRRARAEYYNGAIPWVVIGDLDDGVVTDTASMITEIGLRESAAKWIEPGSVLLAMYGSIGKLGISARALTCNQAIAFARPDPVSAKYLFYYLMKARSGLIESGKGGTQNNISQTVIKAFPFLLAPHGEQHRIAESLDSYLSRLNDATATLERVQASLKRYRASVLKAAVEGRLVPTEAELAGQEGREYESAAVLLERILVERRRRWEEAELAKMEAKGKPPKNDKWKAKYKEPAEPDTADLAELPEGWCWATVGQLAEQPTYGYTAAAISGVQGPRFLRITDIQDGQVDWGLVPTCDIATEDIEKYRLARGDVVFARTGATTGKSYMIRDCPTSIYASYLIRVRPVLPLRSAYLYTFFQSSAYWRQVMAVRKGIAQPSVNASLLGRVCVPVAPVEEQARIASEVDRLLSLAEMVGSSVRQSVHRVTRLRQSILKWAFEGKLVAQDPNDEPASVLLERIKSEREAAATEAKAKKKRARRKGKAKK